MTQSTEAFICPQWIEHTNLKEGEYENNPLDIPSSSGSLSLPSRPLLPFHYFTLTKAKTGLASLFDNRRNSTCFVLGFACFSFFTQGNILVVCSGMRKE